MHASRCRMPGHTAGARVRNLNWQRVPGQPAHVKQARCPWCRLAIQRDTRRRTHSHEAPVCSSWNDLMARAARELGPGAAEPIGLEMLQVDDSDVS